MSNESGQDFARFPGPGKDTVERISNKIEHNHDRGRFDGHGAGDLQSGLELDRLSVNQSSL